MELHEVQTFEDLQNVAEAEIIIDDEDIDGEAIRTTKLYMKYLNYYHRVGDKLDILKDSFAKLELEKKLYYLGKAKSEVYVKKPFNHTITKTDLPMWMNADAEIQAMQGKIRVGQRTLSYLEDVLKQIKDRNFLIKSIIDYRKFISGGY